MFSSCGESRRERRFTGDSTRSTLAAPAIRASNRRRVRRRCKSAAQTAALAVSLPISAHLIAVSSGSAVGGWLALFSLVPLLLAIRLWRPTHALVAGAVWGVSLYLSLTSQPGMVNSPSVGSFALAAAIPAIYAYLASRLTRRIGFSPLVLGVGWIMVDAAFTLLGLGTGLLGRAHEDGAILHWLSQAFGYVLVAFVIAFLSASIVSLLSGVRLSIPPYRCWLCQPDRRTILMPQTLFCLPTCVPYPSRPRAPPWSCLTTRTAAAG